MDWQNGENSSLASELGRTVAESTSCDSSTEAMSQSVSEEEAIAVDRHMEVARCLEPNREHAPRHPVEPDDLNCGTLTRPQCTATVKRENIPHFPDIAVLVKHLTKMVLLIMREGDTPLGCDIAGLTYPCSHVASCYAVSGLAYYTV